MRRAVGTALLVAGVFIFSALPAAAAPLSFPYRAADGFPVDYDPPPVTAASWILYDESTDTVLGEWDADAQRPIASVTKIMTVTVALENSNLDDDVLISDEVAKTGGQHIGLVAGETVKLRALIRGALLYSGNDAAAAIAEHVGGTIDGFVEMMNQRAQELGLENTHFVNPHGLDTDGHYSSARDLLVLARHAMSIPEFANVVKSRVMVFPDAPDGTLRSVTNTNRILNSYEGSIGVKTGQTPRAGLTYVGAAERYGRRLYAVVLHSVGRRAHFADAIALFNWAFEDLGVQGMVSVDAPYQPIAARVTPSPLLVEAEPDVITPSAQGVTPVPETTSEVGVTTGSSSPEGEIVREPEPAPNSLTSTLTYWLGLVTGAFDG
jgi:D-alanyl-D-alanine carboxypeptidase (penicillin-binding protein 5/6)